VLEAVAEDDKVWIAFRRCCESLGVSYARQLAKLKGKSWACVAMKAIHDNSGRKQEMMMVDDETLSGWLFSIDARRLEGARLRRGNYVDDCGAGGRLGGVLHQESYGEARPHWGGRAIFARRRWRLHGGRLPLALAALRGMGSGQVLYFSGGRRMRNRFPLVSPLCDGRI
jgi:hypothetical protein